MMKKKYIAVFLCIIIILGFSGCNDKIKVMNNDKDEIYSFTDVKGNKISFTERPQRVVSLFGSFAETWLLAGGKLIGVTNDVVDEGRIDLDSNVKTVGSVKEPNIEVVIALQPDFVILSSDIEADVKAAEVFKKAGIKYAFFKEEMFSDYLNTLKICTDITGKKDLYEKNGLAVKNKINNIISKVHDTEKPTVLFIRAFSTDAKAKGDDNMTGAMLKDLGTDNIISRHSSLLEDLSIEEIIKEDPQYIFVVTMGNYDKALDQLKKTTQSNPAWSKLDAVKNNRYIILPKKLFQYKPNAQWGDAYEYLAKILYPKIFK